MPTLLQLKSFLAFVDEGGFTAASQRLGMTQPAVSRAVATLEKELGLPLLVRGSGGLSLTVDVAFEAREMSAVLEIVRAGLGVSIMPSAGLPALPSP